MGTPEFSAPASLRTRTCEFWIEGEIMRGRFLPGAEVSGVDARENLDASLRLGRGVSMPTLIDLRDVRSQSAEARALLAGADSMRAASRVALLAGSPLSRVLGSFYLRLNRPQAPTRLFTSVEDARAWLRGPEVAGGR